MANNTKRLTLSKVQLDKYIRAEIKKSKNKIIEEVSKENSKLMTIMPIWVLYNNNNFTKVQCEDFLNNLISLEESIEEKRISMDDLIETFEKETGAKYIK